MAPISSFLRDRKDRAYTLVELVAAAAIVAVLIGVLLDQVRFYQEQAERSAVRSTLATLQAALALRTMAILVKGDPAQIGQLEQENPMSWLAQQPANYAGAFYGEPPDRIPGGGWYFDRTTTTLVYQVWRTRHFETSLPKADIHFKVVAEYGDLNFSRSAPQVLGLRRLQISPVQPYRWFDEGSLAAN